MGTSDKRLYAGYPQGEEGTDSVLIKETEPGRGRRGGANVPDGYSELRFLEWSGYCFLRSYALSIMPDYMWMAMLEPG